MLIEKSKKIVLKLGSSVVDSKGTFKKLDNLPLKIVKNMVRIKILLLSHLERSWPNIGIRKK